MSRSEKRSRVRHVRSNNPRQALLVHSQSLWGVLYSITAKNLLDEQLGLLAVATSGETRIHMAATEIGCYKCDYCAGASVSPVKE